MFWVGVVGADERDDGGRLITMHALQWAVDRLIGRLSFGGSGPEIFLTVGQARTVVGLVRNATVREKMLWLEVLLYDGPEGDLALQVVRGNGCGFAIGGPCQVRHRVVERGLWAFLKELFGIRRRQRDKIMETVEIRCLDFIYRD